MKNIHDIKDKFLNKEISRNEFYSDIASVLANAENEEYDYQINQFVKICYEMKLTSIQMNKVYSRAKILRKMITNC